MAFPTRIDIDGKYNFNAILKCYGPSMEPTLKTKDVIITEQISPRLGRIDIGDVVVARSWRERKLDMATDVTVVE